MTQPLVPLWFAVTTLVVQSMVAAALGFGDSAGLTFMTPLVKFILFIANIGLGTLMLALNIRKSGT